MYREDPTIEKRAFCSFVFSFLPSFSFVFLLLHTLAYSYTFYRLGVGKALRSRAWWAGGERRGAFIISPLIYFTTGLIKKRAPRYIHRTSGGGGTKKLNAFLPILEHASNKGRAALAPSSSRSAPAAQSLLHNASPS